MRTKRTISRDKNGKLINSNFNKSAPLNIYKNIRARDGKAFCNINDGCSTCGCEAIIHIKDMSWNTWTTVLKNGDPEKYNDDSLLGREIKNSTGHTIGTIKDLILPTGDYCIIGLSGDDININNYFPLNVDLVIDIANKECNIPTINQIQLENTPLAPTDGSTFSFEILKIPNVKRAGAPFRMPIAGYRKKLIRNADTDCSGNKLINTAINIPTHTLYADSISKHAKNSPKSCVVYDTRIRSGMQLKPECKDKKQIPSNRALSYNEYNRNKKLNTYQRGLEINKHSNLRQDVSCNYIKANWTPNNNKFKVQGAVSSGSRIDRLKLDTIKSASKKFSKSSCRNNATLDIINNRLYFSGKPRFDGWIYNKDHLENEKKCSKKC